MLARARGCGWGDDGTAGHVSGAVPLYLLVEEGSNFTRRAVGGRRAERRRRPQAGRALAEVHRITHAHSRSPPRLELLGRVRPHDLLRGQSAERQVLLLDVIEPRQARRNLCAWSAPITNVRGAPMSSRRRLPRDGRLQVQAVLRK